MLFLAMFMCIVCTEQLNLVKSLHMLQGVVPGAKAKEASVEKN